MTVTLQDITELLAAFDSEAASLNRSMWDVITARRVAEQRTWVQLARSESAVHQATLDSDDKTIVLAAIVARHVMSDPKIIASAIVAMDEAGRNEIRVLLDALANRGPGR